MMLRSWWDAVRSARAAREEEAAEAGLTCGGEGAKARLDEAGVVAGGTVRKEGAVDGAGPLPALVPPALPEKERVPFWFGPLPAPWGLGCA